MYTFSKSTTNHFALNKLTDHHTKHNIQGHLTDDKGVRLGI